MSAALTYRDDAGDRIVALLREKKARAQKRLAPAARLAGQQLELMMPCILGTGPTGMYGGKVSAVPPGTILFIVADEKGVATICAPPKPDMVDYLVAGAREARAFIEQEKPRGVTGVAAS